MNEECNEGEVLALLRERSDLERGINLRLGLEPGAGGAATVRGLRLATEALDGAENVLAPETLWAMRVRIHPTYAAVADDGHTAVIMIDRQGHNNDFLVRLLPSRQVLLEDADDVSKPVFGPGGTLPYFLYRKGDGEWCLFTPNGSYAVGLEVTKTFGHDGNSVYITDVVPAKDGTCYVHIEGDGDHSEWLFLKDETAERVPAPRHDLQNEVRGIRHHINEAYITSLGGWPALTMVQYGWHRVIGVTTKEDMGFVSSTVHDLTAGTILATQHNLAIHDLLDCGPEGLFAFGGNHQDHLIACAFHGGENHLYEDVDSPEGYGVEQVVTGEHFLAAYFSTGRIYVLNRHGVTEYTCSPKTTHITAKRNRLIGVMSEEQDGRQGVVGVFAITIEP